MSVMGGANLSLLAESIYMVVARISIGSYPHPILGCCGA